MSYEVCIAPRDDFPWLLSRAKVVETNKFWAIEAIGRNGEIKGMIGLDLATPNIVQFHIALDAPIALRKLTKMACKVGFGATRKYGLAAVPGNNERSIKLAKHLGAREVYRIPDGWKDGVDLVMLLMAREECRWLDERVVA